MVITAVMKTAAEPRDSWRSQAKGEIPLALTEVWGEVSFQSAQKDVSTVKFSSCPLTLIL